jgi:biopolymer transport protein ExbD
VFFIIVTLQVMPDAGVSLQLATSSTAAKLVHPQITVDVLADGTIKAKDQVLTPAGLTDDLKADGDPAKTELTIAADRASAFQHFFAVIDAARLAGVIDIGVAARQEANTSR